MYYSNPQVNYMVTVFIRLVIAVVYTLHLLSCSKCFVCLCLFQYRHCFLVGWCTNKSYVIATSDLWLFIHASNLLSLYSPSPLPYNKFHHHHGSIATDTKWIPGDYPSITRAHHSHSLLYPVPSCQVSYWLQEILLFPNAIKDWNDLTEDVAAAPTRLFAHKTFCSLLPK